MKTKTALSQQSGSFPKKSVLNKRQLQDYMWAYIMIGPTVIGLLVLNIWPIFKTAIMSLNKVGGFGTSKWVGFSNFIKMFHDPQVIQATVNTLLYALFATPVGVFLALIVAVLLNSKIRGKSIYRTIYFLPVVSAPAAIAMVWKWLLNYNYGLVNYVLSLVGISGPDWIGNPNYVLLSLIIVGIWSGIGYNMIILLAGLQEIPATFYEAAEIDGANPLRKFFSITLPLVSPAMFFVVVTSLIGSMQVFDSIFMMVNAANPALPKAESLVYLFYKYSFVLYNRGYGSTIAVFLMAIILVITLIQLKLQKKWVYYE